MYNFHNPPPNPPKFFDTPGALMLSGTVLVTVFFMSVITTVSSHQNLPQPNQIASKTDVPTQQVQTHPLPSPNVSSPIPVAPMQPLPPTVHNYYQDEYHAPIYRVSPANSYRSSYRPSQSTDFTTYEEPTSVRRLPKSVRMPIQDFGEGWHPDRGDYDPSRPPLEKRCNFNGVCALGYTTYSYGVQVDGFDFERTIGGTLHNTFKLLRMTGDDDR